VVTGKGGIEKDRPAGFEPRGPMAEPGKQKKVGESGTYLIPLEKKKKTEIVLEGGGLQRKL